MEPIGTTSDYKYVAFFIILGIAFIAITLMLSYAVRRRSRLDESVARGTTYECGEAPVGTAWTQFHVGYYIFALLFVVFDIDTVFLAPWALVMRNLHSMGLGWMGVAEGAVFVALLGVGWLYALRKGVFKWT
ncbi:MAG TPA: NADH-quinone oxidoreductase subunit A [Armatimonadota bacterium]|jgi:NADH:ubiquinone oxidoreductase subunit 3 (subunit A)